jgi:thioredoxin reductase
VYDAIIVGGGPAGLNAALVLGRCRRRVLVCDAGRPRNAASHGLHGFLSRDGIEPRELLRIGREQLAPYGVEVRNEAVSSVCPLEAGFEVVMTGGSRFTSRKLLLAIGVTDRVPPIPGIDNLYGSSVFHCPYCDGWEVRDQPLAALGSGKSAAGLAVGLLTWTRDVVLCTNGPARLRSHERDRLARYGIALRQAPVAALEGTRGILERICFSNGESLPRRGIFFSAGQLQHCELGRQLGCRFNGKGTILTNHLQETGVPGLYAAGDASHDVQFVIVAASEGAKAGVAINTALQREEHP